MEYTCVCTKVPFNISDASTDIVNVAKTRAMASRHIASVLILASTPQLTHPFDVRRRLCQTDVPSQPTTTCGPSALTRAVHCHPL